MQYNCPIMSPKVQLISAAIFGLVSLSIWFVFLRQVPIQTAVGTITTKTFKPADVHIQQPTESGRGFRTPSKVPIAESYIFEIQVDGISQIIRASENTVRAGGFSVGDKVSIQYQERGFPLLWKRLYVLSMDASAK
jgi:hypothetical protein